MSANITNGNGYKINGKERNINGEGENTNDFVKKIVSMSTTEALKSGQDRETPVIKFRTPEQLLKTLDIELSAEPCNDDDLQQHCEDIFEYSVKTGHPRFFNQLFSGIDPYGFAGEVMTSALNASMYTYEVAPVLTLLETIVLERMRGIVGFQTGDGAFCPGGSYSNMMSLNLARYHKFPNVRELGMRQLPRMVIYTSSEGHYSCRKNASLLGFGTSDVVQVRCLDNGKMDKDHLKELVELTVQQGGVPLMVNATAGTTVMGAFDPLHNIADICEKYSMWMHVDTSWGGGVMLSSKHKHLCDGIERADSVAWNPHKLMMAPLQCCVLLTKQKGILKKCNSIHVPYLFQQDKKAYDPSYDSGTQLIQCGRRVDALKIWLMWKAKGDQGFEKQINHVMSVAQYLKKKLKATQGFKLVNDEPECTNVCFWYIPPRLRDCEPNAQFYKELNEIAPRIKEKMVHSGSMLVGYQPIRDLPNFFRMVIINANTNYSDMDFVVSEISKLGRDL